jgi:hypothetical protein
MSTALNKTGSEVVIGYAALRIAYAVALLVAPGRTTRPWLGEVAGEAGTTIAIRGLGVRDLVLSAGALASAASGRSARPWLAACAASDAVDLTATLSADGDQLPSRSKPGTVAAAGAFGAVAAALAVREG